MPIWNGSDSGLTEAQVETASTAALTAYGAATATNVTSGTSAVLAGVGVLLDARIPGLTITQSLVAMGSGAVVIPATVGKVTRVFGVWFWSVTVGASQVVTLLAGDPAVFTGDVGLTATAFMSPTVHLWSVTSDVFFLDASTTTSDINIVLAYDKVDV
jgi:hypothetical protein